jgi:hypothetical protein
MYYLKPSRDNMHGAMNRFTEWFDREENSAVVNCLLTDATKKKGGGSDFANPLNVQWLGDKDFLQQGVCLMGRFEA